MALQTVNIGTVANDGTGDTLRDAMDKVNDNFLLMSNENLIINPDFQIWQRGTSGFSTDEYTADRWALALSGATASVARSTFTVGQTSVPNAPEHYLSLTVTTGDNSVNISQKIEGVEKTAGQEITLSFWAKGTNPGGGSIEFIWFQNFGTGGSPSTAVSNIEDTYTLTGSWQKFTTTFTPTSISGKTLGTNRDDRLQITIRQPSGDAATDAWALDLANVKLEFGNTATPFIRPDFATELEKCQRYFEKSYDVETAPGTVTGSGTVAARCNGTAHTETIHFKTKKRASPSVTTYSSSTGTSGKVYDATGTADLNQTFVGTGEHSTAVAVTSSTDGNLVRFHYTADAEL